MTFTRKREQLWSLLLPAADVNFEEPEVEINKAAEWKLHLLEFTIMNTLKLTACRRTENSASAHFKMIQPANCLKLNTAGCLSWQKFRPGVSNSGPQGQNPAGFRWNMQDGGPPGDKKGLLKKDKTGITENMLNLLQFVFQHQPS